MVKKITISVKDELHEKMMQYKKGVNFSKVFQDAITDLIEKKEGFQKRLKEDSKMEAIVERLKREKLKSEKDYFQQGKNDGLEFAKSAPYDELQYALKWETIEEMPGNIIGCDPTEDEILGAYFADVIENDQYMGFKETMRGHSMPNDLFTQWEAGWKEAIQEFWEQIKNKI